VDGEEMKMSNSTTFARSLIKAVVLVVPIALTATPAFAGSGPAQTVYLFSGVVDNTNGSSVATATVIRAKTH
jgi:hypothetical protein